MQTSSLPQLQVFLTVARLEHGGEVVGVLTESLVARGHGHLGITKLEVMSSMHERNAKMAASVDAFVALPGGFGTTDELFEILTWSQLGLHRKPCAVLNVAGYFDGLLAIRRTPISSGALWRRAIQM